MCATSMLWYDESNASCYQNDKLDVVLPAERIEFLHNWIWLIDEDN